MGGFNGEKVAGGGGGDGDGGGRSTADDGAFGPFHFSEMSLKIGRCDLWIYEYEVGRE